jgi:hypothetical protein
MMKEPLFQSDSLLLNWEAGYYPGAAPYEKYAVRGEIAFPDYRVA